MKPIPAICCCLLATAAPLLAQPVTVPTLGPRYKQTRERTEILFRHRNGDYPAPDPKLGMFQPPAQTVAVVAPPLPNPSNQKTLASDEVLLNEALAVLIKGKGGLVIAGGRTMLTVGVRVYREGDSLSVPVRAGTVQLRIVRISGNSVTLSLNDNEVSWRF